MRRRPVGPLTQALRELGVDVRHEGADGHHPLTIHADGIKGGHVTLDAGLSSQFLTALLLTGPLTAEGLTISVTDLVSAPYIEITLAMMERFGVTVERDQSVYQVPAQSYSAAEYLIEPDASTASYFLAAAAVTGRSVTVPGLGARALQGDLRFAEVLAQMGAEVRMSEDSVTVTGGQLGGVTVAMRDISDTMPTLAAIAPFADGPVRIEDVYNTRVKECDRLEACAENLRALGVPVQVGRDWIEISPARPVPARIACHGDHRIAMAFSITGLRTPGITLDDPDCVKKTFPGFHQALAAWVLQLARIGVSSHNARTSGCQRRTSRAMSSPGRLRPTRVCIADTHTSSGGPNVTAWHRRARPSVIGSSRRSTSPSVNRHTTVPGVRASVVDWRGEGSATPIGGPTAIRARAVCWSVTAMTGGR
jgi:3-phosphoshikimate 1-carboxyvinyltransferase